MKSRGKVDPPGADSEARCVPPRFGERRGALWAKHGRRPVETRTTRCRMKLLTRTDDEQGKKYYVNVLGRRLPLSWKSWAGFFLGKWKSWTRFFFKKIILPLQARRCARANTRYLATAATRTAPRRLFLTTGNLSLLNTLAIIQQLGLAQGASTTIISWSAVSSDAFEEICAAMAASVSPEHYYGIYGSECAAYAFILSHNLTDFDEVYFANEGIFLQMVGLFWPHAAHILTEEGLCGLCLQKHFDYGRLRTICTTRYLDKLDYVAVLERPERILHVQKACFLQVADALCQRYPCPALDVQAEEKVVIFCGTYGLWHCFPQAELLRMEREIIEALLSKGYRVLFKPHPRDQRRHTDNDRFCVVRGALPLECYPCENITAVVSLYSSASAQLYYYRAVPGFIDRRSMESEEFGRYLLIKEYCPPVELLLSVDVERLSAGEVRRTVRHLYEEWLRQKPLLSQNQAFTTRFRAWYDRKG